MIHDIAQTIQDADRNGLLRHPPEAVLTGYSGNKIVGLLQRLTALLSNQPGIFYLEVGVFQGLTLLSTAFANPSVKCFGIDNFAFFDPEGKNAAIVADRMERLTIENAILVNADYEDALAGLGSRIGSDKIGVYFVDGPHDYRSQRVCLDLALRYLSDHAVIVVDDANYAHVRQANADFLAANPEFKLAFEAYTPCHPTNMDQESKAIALAGWWNGVHVVVRDRERRLPEVYPPTPRDRTVFINDHRIHGSEFASEIPELLGRANSFVNASGIRKLLRGVKYLSWLQRSWRDRGKGLFNGCNTGSAGLPEARFNPGLEGLN
jgi:tRNA G46 methylase TrmB